MKNQILTLTLIFAFTGLASAQTETRAAGQASSQTSGSVSKGTNSISLKSGTRVSGDLQNAIDVRRAKVGDEVVLKTTKAIKSEGHTVVNKGARLIGRVTEVAQKTKSDNTSRVGVLFDRLEHGNLALPIAATISSITSAGATTTINNDDFSGASASGSGSARTATSSSTGNDGALLGGVGGAVNSTTQSLGTAVGATTAAVGSTVNSTTGAVGSNATGLGRSLGRIQITQSSSSSVEGGSVLSLQGANMRLEKGTTFNLTLTQSASVGGAKDH